MMTYSICMQQHNITRYKTSLLRTSMASTSLLICPLFCSFLLIVQCQSQDDDCVPLKNCTTLFDLLKNRDNLANFTRVDVYKHLQNVNCGFNGKSPLVQCPDLGRYLEAEL